MFSSYFPPQYSGAAKQAVALAKQLKSLNHHIEFVTMQDPGLPKTDEYDGFIVHRIDIGGRRNQEFPFWLNFLKFAYRNRDQYDILHSHGAHYINSIVGPIAKLMGWKSVVKSTMSHNDLDGMKKPLSGVLHYLFLKSVNAYIAINSDLVKEFKSYGFRRKQIHHIPNGVDTARFHPANPAAKKQLRRRLNLPENRRIVLSVGVFDRRKNIGWLIEKWKETGGFGTDNFLLAIGPQSREDKNGVFLNSLKKIVSENSSDMMLLDHVENIEEYYRAADIYVLTSTNEGLPNVLLEAMASGLPCVATDTQGAKDLIEEGGSGFLFQKNNAAQFQEKLNIINSLGMTEMGNVGQKVATHHYSIKSTAHRYAQLYREIAK